MSTKRLKILFLTHWFPNENNPMKGIFVLEHARSVAVYNDVFVVSFTPTRKTYWKIEKNSIDKVKVFEVRYAGYFARFYSALTGIDGSLRTLKKRSGFGKFIGRILSPFRELLEKLIHIIGVFVVFHNLRKQKKNIDIIHINVFRVGLSGIILKKLYKIPVVVTEHWSAFPLRELSFFQRLEAKFVMKNADIILPVSKALEQSIRQYGIRNRFKIVPNAVDTALFYPPKVETTSRNEQISILTVANLVDIKGIPVLLNALNLLDRQDFKLFIVGDGPRREDYIKLAAQLGIEDKVSFLGFRPKEEIAQLMRRADFFVLPSLYETQSCVIIESMASGLPVIATKTGGIPEILCNECGILVEPNNPVELAEAISYMMDNHKKYNRQKISEYAKNNFGLESIGKKFDSIYRELIYGIKK